MKNQATKKRPHWYFVTEYECPVCGKLTRYRERRYTPKPRDWRRRVEYKVDGDCATQDIAF